MIYFNFKAFNTKKKNGNTAKFELCSLLNIYWCLNWFFKDDQFIGFYAQIFSHRLTIIIIISLLSLFRICSFFLSIFPLVAFASTLFGIVRWIRFGFIHDLVGPIRRILFWFIWKCFGYHVHHETGSPHMLIHLKTKAPQKGMLFSDQRSKQQHKKRENDSQTKRFVAKWRIITENNWTCKNRIMHSNEHFLQTFKFFVWFVI